jgi:hypothetical protein
VWPQAVDGQTITSIQGNGPADSPQVFIAKKAEILQYLLDNSEGLMAQDKDWPENPADEPMNKTARLASVEIKVYRPQEVQEAVIWNLTRKQKVIPASEIEQKKVGIRINKDGNDGGNENDLIEVEFASTVFEGLDLVIKRTSPKLKVFGSKDGSNVILDNNEALVPESMKPPRSYWVECSDDMPSGEIKFYIRPKSGGQDTKLKAIPFRSFKTVVGALSGEVWDNAASASSQGIYKICEDLYLDGYNIHYYPESSVDRCKLEIKDQRDKCEVSDIGVFGYSHGGGSTYDTTLFMGQVNYTGYIDAIRNNFFDINPFAEERYPTGSSYHVNYYQSNWVLTNPPLAGAKTKTPGANVEVDLTSSTKHDTIDDSPIVSSGIKSTLKGKIAP